MSKNLKLITGFCIALNLVTILLIVLVHKHLPPVIPLFYGLPVSVAELSGSYTLALPPIIASCLALINLIIVKFTKDIFLDKILSGLTISLTALSLITVLKIIFLVGSF
ncbi:hypothetical protein BH10PAT1_BH10PAT1_3700 [soil metagenome]